MMQDLKISIAKLQSGDERSFNMVIPAKFCQLPEEHVEAIQPIVIEGTITHAGDFFVLLANITTRLRMQCTRCLVEFEKDVHLAIEEELRKAEGSEDFVELSGDDDLYSTFLGHEIDVGQIALEHLVLSLPIKRLCHPECLGLCPICGQDRNKSKCECKDENIDPRLQALKKILNKENQF